MLFFYFIPLHFFSSFKFDHHFFIAFFIWNNFLNWFCFTILPSFVFFPVKFNSYSFDCYFFFIDNFFKLIFLNWFIINFLIELGSRVLRVASFKDFIKFMMFPGFACCFFFLCLSLFLSHPSIFIELIKTRLYIVLACFLQKILLVLKMTGYHELFIYCSLMGFFG